MFLLYLISVPLMSNVTCFPQTQFRDWILRASIRHRRLPNSNFWKFFNNIHNRLMFIVCICLYAATAKSLQSCSTLCDPKDSNPPGSSVPGILQARTLDWVAISFSNAWKWKAKVKSLSHVRLLATPWTAAYQAPPSMGFSRQDYQSWVPLPSLIIVPNS